jgi:hypothetical protein
MQHKTRRALGAALALVTTSLIGQTYAAVENETCKILALHFSPAWRRAAIWRSNTAGAWMGIRCR